MWEYVCEESSLWSAVVVCECERVFMIFLLSIFVLPECGVCSSIPPCGDDAFVIAIVWNLVFFEL